MTVTSMLPEQRKFLDLRGQEHEHEQPLALVHGWLSNLLRENHHAKDLGSYLVTS